MWLYVLSFVIPVSSYLLLIWTAVFTVQSLHILSIVSSIEPLMPPYNLICLHPPSIHPPVPHQPVHSNFPAPLSAWLHYNVTHPPSATPSYLNKLQGCQTISKLCCLFGISVWQTLCSRGCSTNSFVTASSFSSKSLKYHNSQTVKARELKLLENIHPDTMCHVSPVKCHLSHVLCNFCLLLFHFFYMHKVVELVVGGSVINEAYPV